MDWRWEHQMQVYSSEDGPVMQGDGMGPEGRQWRCGCAGENGDGVGSQRLILGPTA